jgi:hypothetical protein
MLLGFQNQSFLAVFNFNGIVKRRQLLFEININYRTDDFFNFSYVCHKNICLWLMIMVASPATAAMAFRQAQGHLEQS